MAKPGEAAPGQQRSEILDSGVTAVPVDAEPELQVLQGGRPLARLKLVARCSGGGQSSQCRFKKVALAR